MLVARKTFNEAGIEVFSQIRILIRIFLPRNKRILLLQVLVLPVAVMSQVA